MNLGDLGDLRHFQSDHWDITILIGICSGLGVVTLTSKSNIKFVGKF